MNKQANADSDTLSIEDIYSIIDSKMQYLDFQTNSFISTFITKGEQQDFSEYFENESLPPESAASQFILKYIENYSKTLSLLLLLRKSVSASNIMETLSLLSDNYFLNYDEKQLLSLLNMRTEESVS